MPVNNIKDVLLPDPLVIPFVTDITADSPLELVSSFLDTEEKKLLAFTPWKAFAYKPQVYYTIAHGQGSIFLKFYVEEQFVTAACGRANDPVYEDSCVEFFIGFDEKGYYNFEFNCIGTCLAEYGTGRDDRRCLPEESVEKVRSLSVIHRNDRAKVVSWSITLAIPYSTFTYHCLTSLSGMQCRVNFFKCGDALPEPHYVAWTDIEAGEPNFHLPQFFGTMIFK